MTAFGDSTTAIEAMKLGAFDYLSKPVDFEALMTVMLKLSPERKKVFLEMHRVIPLVTYTEAGHSYPEECVKAFAEARRVINEMIAERRANPVQDLIGDLVAARDNNDRLSDEEMFDQIFTVTAGAFALGMKY